MRQKIRKNDTLFKCDMGFGLIFYFKRYFGYFGLKWTISKGAKPTKKSKKTYDVNCT